MKLYHATTERNLLKIISDGVLKPGIDGIVYLAEKREECLRFALLRIPENETTFLYTIEVDLPDNEVFETFDHSYEFFKCKSYGYSKEIPVSLSFNNIYKHEFNRK